MHCAVLSPLASAMIWKVLYVLGSSLIGYIFLFFFMVGILVGDYVFDYLLQYIYDVADAAY